MFFNNHHIGRTAGTTLDYILRRNFGEEYLNIGKSEIQKYLGKAPLVDFSHHQINSGELNSIINHCEKFL